MAERPKTSSSAVMSKSYSAFLTTLTVIKSIFPIFCHTTYDKIFYLCRSPAPMPFGIRGGD